MKKLKERIANKLDDIILVVLFPLMLGRLLVGYGLNSVVMLVLKQFGETCDGRILSSTRKGHPSDDEVIVFSLTYEFVCRGQPHTGEDTVCINEMHVSYASGGALRGAPHIAFGFEDVCRSLQKGAPMRVRCLPALPSLHVIGFDDIVQQAMEL